LDGLRLAGGNVDAINQAWRELMLRYRTYPTLRNYLSEEALVDRYIECLSGIVKTNLSVTRPTTLEAAYNQAHIVQSSLPKRAPLAAAGAAMGRGRGTFLRHVYATGSPSPSPVSSRGPSRAGTPAPPGVPLNSVEQELAALRAEVAALRGETSYPHLGAVGGSRPKFYSTDRPPPPMTPGERRWCMDNRACFRCREAQAGHAAATCPRFAAQRAVHALTDDGLSDYASRPGTPAMRSAGSLNGEPSA
jgi:hypothetical protein